MNEEIEELEEIETLSFDETSEESNSRESVGLTEKPLPEVIPPIVNTVKPNEASNYSNNSQTGPSQHSPLKNNSNYISYEKRIMKKVALALIFFAVACVLLGKALKTDEVKVTYNENSNVNYKVCLAKNQYYKEECLEPEMEYLSTITKKIPITFNYAANYSSIVNYNYKYYIKADLKIYNPDSDEKVLYKESNQLTPKEKISNSSDIIAFSASINIDFEKYNNYVNEYKSKYSLSTDSSLEVSLYLEDENKSSRKVSGVVIPLSSQTYSIAKNEASNTNISASSVEKSWKNKNIIYAIAASIFSILGIITIIKICLYILKTTKRKSLYEIKLNQILKEYDRIIVRMEDKEKFINSDKQEIKVYDFLELLDARDTLERPIIYIKVNNIKSEFYLEDMNRVYKYVMKESDFLEKDSKHNSKK